MDSVVLDVEFGDRIVASARICDVADLRDSLNAIAKILATAKSDDQYRIMIEAQSDHRHSHIRCNNFALNRHHHSIDNEGAEYCAVVDRAQYDNAIINGARDFAPYYCEEYDRVVDIASDQFTRDFVRLASHIGDLLGIDMDQAIASAVSEMRVGFWP